MTERGREEVIDDWLVINWQDLNTRTRKSKPQPGDLGPRELATQLQLTIRVPDVELPTLDAEVEVPAPRVEASELEDVDAEDVPDWQDVADELVERYGTDDWDARDVKALTVETLEEAAERPDVDDVQDHIRSALRERQWGDGE